LKPSRHVATSAVFSLALAPWLLWKALIVFVGGLLPDLDRYLWHAIRYRTLKVRPAIERFQGKERIRGGVRFFHSIEWVAAMAIAGIWWTWASLLTMGMVFHILTDVFLHKKRGRFWFYFDPAHAHSLTMDAWRSKTRPQATSEGAPTPGGDSEDEE
jgi:hypothetical protein